eukprot:TRINITY_DN65455_c0_g1_i1.p1 TRINITY_DN65455_c0_g1~~TRINITY_DN65455_c0_g1_i1.p1  ORF type:complete len:578 (+),score=67.19 TRINITY_DN65455_c0_g1_i1:199-1734(+)
MATKESKEDVPSSTHDLYRFQASVCWFQFFISGVFYGLSPLALPVSRAFLEDAADVSLESGLFFFGFAILMFGNSAVSAFSAFYMESLPAERKRYFISCGYIAWLVSFALLALAVQFRAQWLLLGGAFPLMGIGSGVQIGYVNMVLVGVAWGRKANFGFAYAGGASGFGALAWTLIFGEVCNALGDEGIVTAMWIYFALQVVGVAVGYRYLHPGDYLLEKQATALTDSQSAKPEIRIAKDWRVYVFVFVAEAFFTAGLTLKTLMSELFEKLFSLEYIHAVRYSAACLAAYAVARGVSPFLAFGDRVFWLFTGVLLMEGCAYFLTPIAVRLEVGRLEIYTCFRLLGGIGFAILLSNTGVLLVRIFGPEYVTKVTGAFLATEFVIGLGPSIAFSLHVAQVRSGTSNEHSYDFFFQLASVMVLMAAAGVIALWRDTLRRRKREQSLTTAAAGGDGVDEKQVESREAELAIDLDNIVLEDTDKEPRGQDCSHGSARPAVLGRRRHSASWFCLCPA